MEKGSKILIIGDNDIVGRELIEYFKNLGYKNVLSESTYGINLIEQNRVEYFFSKINPEYVFLANLKSGGIAINIKSPAEFIYDNLQIQNNIIHCSYKYKVKKLLFLASSCVYPLDCKQPIKEEYFLGGKIEDTSSSYAVAKIAGIKMCQAYHKQYGMNFISVIPATVYGPGDNFDMEKSHVLPALIRNFHHAKINKLSQVIVWGSGNPLREFLYISDMVKASLFLMDNYKSPEIINVGSGEDISIKKLSALIRKIVGFKGKIVFDSSKLEGALKKQLDNGKIKRLGWKAEISLEEGINKTYNWYKNNEEIK